MGNWQVFALKYAEHTARTRAFNFIQADNQDALQPMDYFIWVLRREDEVILVDSGYDTAEGVDRDRPILREPGAALAALGLKPEAIETLIVTHLHYDHAGGLAQFPNATLHMQAAEMAYATGPCMCHGVLQKPFSAPHVCEAIKRLYSGRMQFHDGDGEVAEGVTVHCIGGHSRGLQVVRVRTEAGWLCLASDATHYYENAFTGKPFTIVVDMQDMLDGFGRLHQLASEKRLIVPGHDPLVTEVYPAFGPSGFVWKLDHGPERIPEF